MKATPAHWAFLKFRFLLLGDGESDIDRSNSSAFPPDTCGIPRRSDVIALPMNPFDRLGLVPAREVPAPLLSIVLLHPAVACVVDPVRRIC